MAMLEFAREVEGRRRDDAVAPVERVRGDALRPPFLPASFAEVALVGNALGFEERSGEALLDGVERLVAPGGLLVVEVAPGPGERANYLARLPPGAVRRTLAAPPWAVLPRLRREGFRTEPTRHHGSSFRRWTAEEIIRRWNGSGWRTREAVAVAPALGPDAERLEEVAKTPRAWERLLELEEQLGREPARWTHAAAVLLAGERPLVDANGLVRGVPSFSG